MLEAAPMFRPAFSAVRLFAAFLILLLTGCAATLKEGMGATSETVTAPMGDAVESAVGVVFEAHGYSQMSSSKGIGVTSRDMADFLPPEVLRFLMLRTPPKQHVNFEPTEVHIIKAFNEFDRARQRYFHDPNIKPDDMRNMLKLLKRNRLQWFLRNIRV